MRKLKLLSALLLILCLILALAACGNVDSNENKNDDNDIDGDNDVRFSIIIDSEIENGTVTASKTSAKPGEVITVTMTPNNKYVLYHHSIFSSKVWSTTLEDNKFTMPSFDVTIKATFIRYYEITFVHQDKIIGKSTPTEYENIIPPQKFTEKYKHYAIEWYRNAACTQGYLTGYWYSDAYNQPVPKYATEDITLYAKLTPSLSAIEKERGTLAWQSGYSFNLGMNVVTDAKARWGVDNYYFIDAEVGQTIVVATQTKYFNMDSSLMLSVAPLYGDTRTDNVTNIKRFTNPGGSIGLTFKVTETGRFYFVMLYKDSSFKNFDYVYTIAAAAHD